MILICCNIHKYSTTPQLGEKNSRFYPKKSLNTIFNLKFYGHDLPKTSRKSQLLVQRVENALL